MKKAVSYLLGSDSRVAGATALYVLVIGLIVQLFAVPVFLPQMDNGVGLFTPDATLYHRLAVGVYERMLREGWGGWDVAPDGYQVSGLVAALYYLFVPLPGVVLVFTAMLAGLSVKLILAIGELAGVQRGAMRAGALAFFLFPSAMLFLAQINKDILFFVGFLLFVHLALALNAKIKTWEECSWHKARVRLRAMLPVLVGEAICGFLFLVFSRPHVSLLLELSLVVGGLAVLVWHVRRPGGLRRGALLLVALLALIGILHAAGNFWSAEVNNSVEHVEQDLEGLKETRTVALTANRREGKARALALSENRQGNPFFHVWPPVLEGTIQRLIDWRLRYAKAAWSASLAFDLWDVQNVDDFIAYIPRALTVACCFPTVGNWVDIPQPKARFLLFVTGFETLLADVGLVGFLIAAYRRRISWDVFCILAAIFFCVILPIVYSAPNLGTIYRLRYAPFMLVACIGWGHLLQGGLVRSTGFGPSTRVPDRSGDP